MSWIRTYSGKKFDPLDLPASEFCLDDIAHALAHICRYNGHCREFYSVGQHSVHVAQIVHALGGSLEQRIFALMHDASEAYLGDIPRPFKMQALFAYYRDAERQVQEAIHLKLIGKSFEILTDTESIIHKADMMCLAAEARDLMGDPQDWSLPEPPWSEKISPMGPLAAKHAFTASFKYLMDLRAAG